MLGFADEKSLNDYLNLLEEAKEYHRRLGKELDLFQVNERSRARVDYFPSKGMMLRYIIELGKKEHLKQGYEMVMGPQLLKVDLETAIMNIIVRTCISRKLMSRLTE